MTAELRETILWDGLGIPSLACRSGEWGVGREGVESREGGEWGVVREESGEWGGRGVESREGGEWGGRGVESSKGGEWGVGREGSGE